MSGKWSGVEFDKLEKRIKELEERPVESTDGLRKRVDDLEFEFSAVVGLLDRHLENRWYYVDGKDDPNECEIEDKEVKGFVAKIRDRFSGKRSREDTAKRYTIAELLQHHKERRNVGTDE